MLFLPEWSGAEMRAYSQDLRERVLRALERGEGPTDIAVRLEVSREWVYQVSRRYKQTGQRGSLPMGGHRRSRVAAMESTLRAWIAAEVDVTLAELCARLGERGIVIKVAALWHQLNQWKLTFKKNSARQRAVARRGSSGARRLETQSAHA
jgi:transposase